MIQTSCERACTDGCDPKECQLVCIPGTEDMPANYTSY